MPLERMLYCTDPFEVLVMQAVTQKVHTLMDQRDDQLAIKVANAVGHLIGAK